MKMAKDGEQSQAEHGRKPIMLQARCKSCRLTKESEAIYMSRYVTGNSGRCYKVEFPCIIEKDKASRNGEGKTWVFVTSDWSFSEHYLQVYYRHEHTWDDHMGNTPCGYYCIVPLPDGSKRRVYMF